MSALGTEIEGCRLLGNKPRPSPTGRRCRSKISAPSPIASALVAAGRFDAMVSLTSKRDWDLAAADIILSEAGGSWWARTVARSPITAPPALQGATVAAGPA